MNMMTIRAAPAAVVRRTFVLDDITIRSDGDGRTVDAYAAVFDVQSTISDFEGNGYLEVIRPGTFARTIAQRAGRMQVIYNHGLDIYGNPAPEFSKPLGVVLEMREDQRGLFTTTRYSKTPLADEVLELIRDGAIRGQSFGGRWVQSRPQRGPYRTGQVVERLEVAMNEFGPTPFPSYADAAVIGVRSVQQLANDLAALTADERAELTQLISGTPTSGPADPGTATTDPPNPDEDPEPPAATTPVDLTDELELRRRRLQLT